MPLPQPLLTGRRCDYMISNLIEGTVIDPTAPSERRLLNLVLPPWQRKEVWSRDQQIRFIESIFLGLGAGYYVVNGADWDDDGTVPMSGWLLDGQQRISAIRDFIQGEFLVFGDVSYSSLDEPTRRRRFLRQPFPCFQLEYCGDEGVLKELYNRLNFGGTPHEPHERAV